MSAETDPRTPNGTDRPTEARQLLAHRRQAETGAAVPGAGPACFSRDSVAESETPVFQAFLTTPSEQQRFTFPAPQDTGAGHFDTDPSSPHGDPGPRYPQPATDPSPPHRETEPTRPHWETAPKSPLYETAPKYPYQETDAKYPYQETGPKYPYQETGPKYPDQQTDPKYPYSETDPKYPFSQTDTRYPKQETDPKYPYQETDSKYTYQETFPKYPYQETDPKYPDAERTPPGGRRPVTAAGAGGRRFSEAASPRPRRLDETGRSQSEEGWRLPPTRVLLEQATLESDETGSPGVSSDMRGLHMDVRDSSNVHVGPKVIDQRNIHVARLDSRVDNLHRHEHVQEKHEHIRSKHEHVQNKTEVHSKTENIKHEHIQNKHEYIQVNKTEIVHTNAKAIFADRLYFGYDCSVRHDAAARSAPSSPSRVSLEPRQFQEGRRFLETRYTSWTTLSMPLPWYDDMVLDLSKSCVDFTMVSTGSGSVGTYNGVEQLVREQLGRQQQPERALRIVVEGHAGYGKTTLAAKVAYDWATGQDYLKQFSHAFLVLLREFRGSLDEHIKSQHYPLELGDGDAFLQYLKTNQEKVLFIFDGYDELPKEGRETIDQIMSGRAFVHSGAVMTSRPMTMMFKKYCQVVGLVGFDDRKKSEFVRLVYKDRPQMRIDAFLRVLAGDRSVSELAQCPLMCLLLCEMHQRGAFGGRATKSKLYSELFLYLVDKAVHRRLPQPLAEERARLAASYDEALGRFGQFCLQCLACDQLSFTEQQIPKGCEAGKLFDVGFIVKCRNFTSYMGSETYYEPIHKTFMEFLAAKYLKSIVHEEEHLKRELLRLRQGTSRASERLVLQYLCGLLQADAWTVMEQLDADDVSLGHNFVFSLLREAGDSPQNVAAVCRRMPHDKVVIRGSDEHLAVWALCLSSPASEVSEIEFIWEFDCGRGAATQADLVTAQLDFWSALQSCSNVTDLRVTFLYGHSSEVPPPFMDAMCECMKHCARLARLAVLHVKAIAPDNAADSFLPVVTSLSRYVRCCASLHRLTVEMNLSSPMSEQLCAGLTHVPRLQTLHLPRLYCDAAGFSALAALIRQHVSLKTLDVSVFLVDGPVDLACTSYTQLNRKAMGRNRKMSVSPEAVRKVPLHRAGPGRPHPTADQGLRARSNPDRPRTGPDQELERLNAVLAVNLKDERRVRVVDGIWHLVDQAGSRAMYPLPMCDKMSHRSGYHQLFEAVRSRGARLENLTIGRESLTKQDFVCLGETIRKSESLTALSIANVEKVANIFPLITGLPTARRLESLLLRSPLSDVNDFLFSVFCRCLEDNASLQELNIQQWKFKLESPASVDQLRSLMKNTSVQRLDAADCRVTLACRVDDLTFPCASICRLNLSNCSVETSGDSLRGATLLPLLQGLSALKQLDLSHSAAPPLNDAAVKAFFAGLSSFKTLQELAICGWSYDVTNPEAAYAETKAAARKWSRLTTVRVDKSQFTARAAECGKQWLVQAMATGVPHLQELRFSSLTLAGHATCAITRRQVESLAKAILKAKWTGHALRLYMQQVDPRLVGTFVELTSSSSRIDVTSNGRIVMFKRLNSGQWWRLRPR